LTFLSTLLFKLLPLFPIKWRITLDWRLKSNTLLLIGLLVFFVLLLLLVVWLCHLRNHVWVAWVCWIRIVRWWRRHIHLLIVWLKLLRLLKPIQVLTVTAASLTTLVVTLINIWFVNHKLKHFKLILLQLPHCSHLLLIHSLWLMQHTLRLISVWLYLGLCLSLSYIYRLFLMLCFEFWF
jgi:hypothetical protein